MSKLYWIAHCGEHAIERTSCMVEVEHFTDEAKRDKRLAQVVNLHRAGQVDSFTYDEVNMPLPHKRFEVHMQISGGWENVWGEFDEENNRSPLTFATAEEAETEIAEVIADSIDGFTRDMFRIVTVEKIVAAATGEEG